MENNTRTLTLRPAGTFLSRRGSLCDPEEFDRKLCLEQKGRHLGADAVMGTVVLFKGTFSTQRRGEVSLV